jgi:glycosyltransferase involved in cell wall biosynthesis
VNIWLVKLEEALPIDESYRAYRMGMLADALIQRGHHVTRWASDHLHLSGKNRFGIDKTIKYSPNQTFEILSSQISYNKPLSLMRLANNYYLANKFQRISKKRQKPDLIICSMPTPRLAKISSFLGKKLNIPVVIDARDFWPDISEKELFGFRKYLFLPIVKLMKRDLIFATKNATSLVGITEFYRDHLLNYANRTFNENLDSVFPLGYPQSLNMLSEEEQLQARLYWNEILGKGWDLGNRKVVYFAGRFNSTVFNALDPVVSLVKNSLSSWPNYLFVFCGSGQYEKEIRSQLSGLENAVMPGEVNAQNLSYLRRFAYLAIQPLENRVDYLNSLSNKFFEYISSGLPIISSLKGITGEIIEKNEIGFVYINHKELLEYMDRLYYDSRLRENMSLRAKKFFLAEYSAEKVYEKFSEHCERVVEIYRNNR